MKNKTSYNIGSILNNLLIQPLTQGDYSKNINFNIPKNKINNET